MPKKKKGIKKDPDGESAADGEPVVYDRATVHRTLWGDTDAIVHGIKGKTDVQGDAGVYVCVLDTIGNWMRPYQGQSVLEITI